MPQSPEVGLLGILNDFVPRSHALTLLCMFLFYECKLILLHWKDAVQPFTQQFYHLVNADMPEFKLLYKGGACPKKFTKIW